MRGSITDERASVNQRPQGQLDPSEDTLAINGWLAVIGDPAPRRALVRIDGTELHAVASIYRHDLEANGINQGRHGFSLSIPPEHLDGHPHEIVLLDADTGEVVSQRTIAWSRQRRDYEDFAGFLRHSMTQPVTSAPFTAVDLECIAAMDALADRLCARAAAAPRPPLVSVVMPVFNRASLVGQAIESVIAQRYPHLELIVVDDGSSDGSAAAARGFGDPRVKVVELGRNMGHSAARNAGLRAARGDIVAYLDSDNHWDERYVGAIVGAFEELPRADALSTGQYVYRGSERTPHALRYGHLNLSLLENQNYIDLNAFAHRRAAIAGDGGFDEGLRRFVDYDLVLRIAGTGRLWSVPLVLSHYHQDRAERTVSKEARFAGDLDDIRARHQARTGERLAARAREPLRRRVHAVVIGDPTRTALAKCLAGLEALAATGMLVVEDRTHPQQRKATPRRRSAGAADPAATPAFTALMRDYGVLDGADAWLPGAHPDADILVVDAQTVLQPGAIQSLQATAWDLADAGATVPRYTLPAGSRSAARHVPYANVALPVDISLSARERNISDVGLYHDGGPVPVRGGAACAMYFRRAAFEGLLPPAEGAPVPTTPGALADRLSASGFRIYNVPAARALRMPRRKHWAIRLMHRFRAG